MRKENLPSGAIEMVEEKEILEKRKELKNALKDKTADKLSNEEVKELVFLIAKKLGIL